jgi:hypothetical protein
MDTNPLADPGSQGPALSPLRRLMAALAGWLRAIRARVIPFCLGRGVRQASARRAAPGPDLVL